MHLHNGGRSEAMTVLILGQSGDEHARHMCDHLCARGADAIQIDPSWFPGRMTIAFDPTEATGEIVTPEGRAIPFDQVSSVYWRNYDGVQPSDLPDEDQAFVAENDARGLFESVLIWLPARW
jgi:hypothetical protein